MDYATFDIETTGLTPDDSELVAIAVAHKDEPKVLTREDRTEKELVEKFVEIMQDLNKDDKIVTYNGDTFDWPFLIARSMKFNDYGDLTDKLFNLKENHSLDLFKTHGCDPDTGYLKLEDLLERHGLSHDVECDGSMVPELYEEGAWSRIERYAEEDVVKTHELCGKLSL